MWLALIVVPLVVIAVGCLVWPELFWERYVWRHIWAPLVADAEDRTVGGIGEGYTVTSTLTFAYFLAVAVFGIWRAFQQLGVKLDAGFLVALVPWVVVGAEARALEDAGLFAESGPLVYLFISPLIYIVEGLVVFALVVLTTWSERLARERGWTGAVLRAGALLAVLNLVLLAIVVGVPEQLASHAAAAAMPVASVVALGLMYLWGRSRRELGMRVQVLAVGCVLVATASAFVGAWALDPWAVSERPTHAAEVGVILTIALGCTTATYGAYWALSRRWPQARAFLAPVSVLLFLSHYVDGAATFRGLDAFGYGEKHVLPSFLIDLTGTAAVMLALKFLVVTVVVYLLDVAYREDMEHTPTLAWLVKVAVMVLGLAPGVRDALRIAMGV